MYAFYLKKMGLDEAKMNPIQKRQLKNAFYGAIGTFISLIEEPEVANLPPLAFDNAVHSIYSEIHLYWIGHLAMHGKEKEAEDEQ